MFPPTGTASRIHSPMDSIQAAGESWVAPRGPTASRPMLSPDEAGAGGGVLGAGGCSGAPACPPLTCPLQLPVAVQLPLCLGPVAAVGPQGSLVLRHHAGAWDRSGDSGVTSPPSPGSWRGPPGIPSPTSCVDHALPRGSPRMRTSRQPGAGPPSRDPGAVRMLSPAEPVKPVSQPSRESRSAMYSLWSQGWSRERRPWAPAGEPVPGGTVRLLPYHVGIRGGHDVGVDAVGLHGAPQSGEPRHCVGGRRGQVLVAQGDTCWGGHQLQRWGWAGVTPHWVSQERGGLGTVGLTGGSTEQSRTSVLAEAACGGRPAAQPGDTGTPWSLRLQPGVPLAPCSSPEPVPRQL